MAFSQEVTDQLRQPLSPDRVSKRSGGQNGLSYIEGYDAIDTANRIFGYDGWSMYQSQPAFFPHVGEYGAYVVTATVEADNASRQDSGMGLVTARPGTQPSAEAHETAMKGAATDAMKRAMRTFGNQFGNSLYDKDSPLHAASGNTNRPSIPGSAPAFQRPAANNVTSAGSAAPSSGVGRPASVRQVNFARSLAREQSFDVDKYAGVEYGGLTLDQLTSTQISAVIEYLQRRVAGGPGEAPAAPQRPAPRRAASASTDDVPF